MNYKKRNKYSLSNIGLIIQNKLIEINLSQKELAHMIGANEVYISNVLHGRRTGKKYLDKIENVLGIKLLK